MELVSFLARFKRSSNEWGVDESRTSLRERGCERALGMLKINWKLMGEENGDRGLGCSGTGTTP